MPAFLVLASLPPEAPEPMVNGAFRYWAFLSYSHLDRRAAERLHRALEGYRLPLRLVGRQGPLGPVPRQLHPIFRDRDELTASGQIGAVVESALAGSRALIVMCSPAAAESEWVEAEIRAFHRLRPDAPVLCVIGESLASRSSAIAIRECLPPSLRARFQSGVGIDDRAPVAVDLRPGGDGWRLGVQKLVAGLAGVPLDQLVQRDARRRHLRLAWLSATLAVIAMALGTMAVFALRARDEAQHQRAQAEGLIEFMLGDLRQKLEPVGRLDALDAVGTRALQYYDSQDPRVLDADALGRRSRALHMIGDLRDRRGDRNSALQAFQRASETTAELLQRNPGDPQRIFDQAQSVYWVGYAGDWQAGKSAAAEQAFLEYQRLAKQLVAKDPNNLAWQAEVAYSHANLGVMLMDLGRAREAMTQFEISRRVNEHRAAAKSSDLATLLDLGQDYSWLSSASLQTLLITDSVRMRQREIGLYVPILQRDPRNAVVIGRMMIARRFLASALIDSGDLGSATEQLAIARSMARAQRQLEPDNTDWTQADAKALLMQAELLGWQGQPQQGLDRLAYVRPLLANLLARDANAWAWKVELQESFAQVESDLLRMSSRRGEALRVAEDSVHRLRTVMQDPQQQQAKTRRWLALSEGRLARLLDEDHQHDAAQEHWRAITAILAANPDHLDAEGMLWLARADAALSKPDDAQRLRQHLVNAGYLHPEFIPRAGTGAVSSTAEAGVTP